MEIVNSAGVRIFLASEMVEEGLVWETVTEPGYWFGALLTGRLEVRRSPFGESRLAGGETLRFSTREPIETRRRALSAGPISAVFVNFSAEAAYEILGEEALAGFDDPEAASPAFPAFARSIAWRMMGCSLQGPARRLYLGAKALEIAAHALSGAAEPVKGMTPRDVEKLHEARAILTEEMAAPPSLPDLAKRLGLNLARLNHGFHELFGQPPYAWLKARRLERGKALLESEGLSVSDAARRIGYQPQHFATEFRRRFGIAPSESRR